jgi:hypothetical protein
MTVHEADGDQTLHGSLHSLRTEYEEIREMRRTRRYEMLEAQVKMNVRKASNKTQLCKGPASPIRRTHHDRSKPATEREGRETAP